MYLNIYAWIVQKNKIFYYYNFVKFDTISLHQLMTCIEIKYMEPHQL